MPPIPPVRNAAPLTSRTITNSANVIINSLHLSIYVTNLISTPKSVAIYFATEINKTYELQSSKDLHNWTLTQLANGTGGTLTLYDSPPESRFYRVRQVLPQITNSWVKNFGGNGTDYGTAVATDGDGNVIVAGYFTGTINFGDGPLVSTGGWDICMAKFSQTGSLVWSKRYGGTGDERVNSIATDSYGNIILGGYFLGTGNFGGANITSAGQGDGFIAKYSPQGDHWWSRGFGAASADTVTGIAIDSQGNILATGRFFGSVNFGGIALVSYLGTPDVFLAKYSPGSAGILGRPIWVKNFSNVGSDGGAGIAVDKRINPLTQSPYDTIAITGGSAAGINFGQGPIQTSGGFLAKFTPEGDAIWSRGAGSNNANPTAIAVAPNGDFAVTGTCGQQSDFGGGTIQGGANNGFVATYSGANGTYRWANMLQGDIDVEPAALTYDAQNNVVVGGYYVGTCVVGTNRFTTINLSDYNGILAKYSTTGANVLWTENMDGSGIAGIASLSRDSAGQILTAGGISGMTTLQNHSLTAVGPLDVLVGRLNP